MADGGCFAFMSGAKNKSKRGAKGSSDVAGAIASGENVWSCDPCNGHPLRVRSAPRLEALVSSAPKLQPGELFVVSEEREIDGVIFLKLADDRGWLFDKKPGVGTMCTKVNTNVEEWRCNPCTGRPLTLLSAPKMDSKPTGKKLMPGDIFRVAERHLGGDGVLYMRLVSGEGWACDKKPGVGTMCVSVSAPASPAAPAAASSPGSSTEKKISFAGVLMHEQNRAVAQAFVVFAILLALVPVGGLLASEWLLRSAVPDDTKRWMYSGIIAVVLVNVVMASYVVWAFFGPETSEANNVKPAKKLS